MSNIEIMGDIAYYYLQYVEDILKINQGVKFICIKRDKEKTVNSWVKKTTISRWPSLWIADRFKSIITGTPFYKSKNHWQEHDGSTWELDPVWDKTFPNFKAHSKKEAISKYWDYYYNKAASLVDKYPVNVKVFPIDDMSSKSGQTRILEFIGIPEDKMVLSDEVHLHKS